MEMSHPHDLEETVSLISPLVTFANTGGAIEVWSSEWLGVVGSPPRLTVCLGPRFAVASGNAALACFGVSLPPVDLRVPPWLPALLAGSGSQVLADAGLGIAFGSALGAPLVDGFPVVFECRNGEMSVHAGVVLVTAEVAAIHSVAGGREVRGPLRQFTELLPGTSAQTASRGPTGLPEVT